MKLSITKGVTSQIWFLKIRKVSTGQEFTGLAFNTSGLTAYYVRPGAAPVQVPLVTQTVTGAYAAGGFVEVSSVNMPGIYRFDPPNAMLATGVDHAVLVLRGVADMEQVDVEVQLTVLNLQDGVRAGLTSLPNVVSGNAGALLTAGTGVGQLDVTQGRAQADVARISGGAVAADNLEAMFDGSGYNAAASNIGSVGVVQGVDAAVTLAVASAVKSLIVETEGGYNLGQVLSMVLAYVAGVTTEGGTRFKTPNGVADRIRGTVNGSAERTSITLTPSA